MTVKQVWQVENDGIALSENSQTFSKSLRPSRPSISGDCQK